MRPAALRPPPRIAEALLAAALLALSAPACGDDDEQGSSRSAGDGMRVAGADAQDSHPESPEQSIRSYGIRADTATEKEIATAVGGFYAAKSAGDGAEACRLLASATRDALVETLARSGEGEENGKGCASILARLLEDQEPRYRDRIAGVQVTGTRVRNARGLALIDIEATPEEVIPVRREHGSWKVAALAGSEIP
jgi:hypothetical protein